MNPENGMTESLRVVSVATELAARQAASKVAGKMVVDYNLRKLIVRLMPADVVLGGAPPDLTIQLECVRAPDKLPHFAPGQVVRLTIDSAVEAECVGHA